MCRNRIVLTAVWAISSMILVSCGAKQEPVTQEPSIEEHRKTKDESFRDWNVSPLPKKEIAAFKGLDYFPATEQYKVKAIFKRATGEKPFAFPATNDTSYVYVKYGELFFTINETPCTLSVYQSPEITSRPGQEDYLFIPFTDLTNGKETYGGGRYIDYRIPKAAETVIDFNYAYNPYCVYNPKGFYCPIPPKENQLNVRIEAGEKNFAH